VLGFGQVAHFAIGSHVEADDRGVGGGRERDVVLGDRAHAAVHERRFHVVTLELAEALGDCLERAVHVGLDEQVEHGGLAGLDLGKDVFQLHALLRARIAALGEHALALRT